MPVRAVALAIVLAVLAAAPAAAGDVTHTAFVRGLPEPPARPTLCIVDTGVTDTPATASLIVQRTSVVGGDGLDVVSGGHGSIVASIAAATFPRLRIASVRVASQPTSIAWADVARAMNACIASHDEGPLVVAMSIQGDASADASAVAHAVDVAKQRDVSVVVSAGNQSGVVAPLAQHPGVIGVTGISPNGGRCAFVPAAMMTLIAAVACPAAAVGSDGRLLRVSGTSFAVPQVAAVLAALRAYNPSLDAVGAATVLVGAARSTTAGRRLDGHAAFEAAGLGHLIPRPPSIRVRRVLKPSTVAVRVTTGRGVRLLLLDRGRRRLVHRRFALRRVARGRVATLVPVNAGGQRGAPIRIRVPALPRRAA